MSHEDFALDYEDANDDIKFEKFAKKPKAKSKEPKRTKRDLINDKRRERELEKEALSQQTEFVMIV